MRYFDYLQEEQRRRLFLRCGTPFTKTSPRNMLRGAVGGLLYIPGLRTDIARIIMSGKVRDLSSMAICLEDSVGDLELDGAIKNVDGQLSLLGEAVETGALPGERLPLLFIRVRGVEMLEEMADLLVRHSPILTGVVLPKVTPESLSRAMSLVGQIHSRCRDPFYAMPILESMDLMSCADRLAILHRLRACADSAYERVLNIRVGATDLCGLYGIRRRVDTPIYSVAAVADCITDVVRVFGLGDRYTVSGPVWEYYRPVSQAMADGGWDEIGGLMREVALDQQNGFCGKTCIHPTQLLPVQAGYVVPWDMYQDAAAILDSPAGVLAGVEKNRMNETKPHSIWAARVMRRASLFGVFQKDAGVRDLFRAACPEL